jgi:hypothetical protein
VEFPVTEDFTYMVAGFCYYLPAALSYLESEEATGTGRCSRIDVRTSCRSRYMAWKRALALIKQIADYCDAHREKFGLGSVDRFDEYLQKIPSAKPFC